MDFSKYRSTRDIYTAQKVENESRRLQKILMEKLGAIKSPSKHAPYLWKEALKETRDNYSMVDNLCDFSCCLDVIDFEFFVKRGEDYLPVTREQLLRISVEALIKMISTQELYYK